MAKKIEDYRDQTAEQLEAACNEVTAELFRFRNEGKMSGKVEKSHKLREGRRSIARMRTVIREKRVDA